MKRSVRKIDDIIVNPGLDENPPAKSNKAKRINPNAI